MTDRQDRIEVLGGADPLVTAAIIAAVARLEEELAAEASNPAPRPSPGKWVMSGRPREVSPPVARPAPSAGEWSIASGEEGDGADA